MTERVSTTRIVPGGEARCSILRRGTLRLRQLDTFAEPSGRACRRFLDRILSLDFVRRVDIHPAQGAAEIKFIPREPAALVLRRMAEVLQGNSIGTLPVT